MENLERFITECETKSKKKKNNIRRIYEDDNWIIDILSEDDYNPCIRVSRLKDNHFVDDIEISGLLMESDELELVKDIIYR